MPGRTIVGVATVLSLAPSGQLYLQHLVSLLQGLICSWLSSLAIVAEVPVLYPAEQGNEDERVMLVDGPLMFQGQEKKLGSGPINPQGLHALGLHRCFGPACNLSIKNPPAFLCWRKLVKTGKSFSCFLTVRHVLLPFSPRTQLGNKRTR